MPPVAFTKRSPDPVRFDKKLGVFVGWAAFSKKNGEDYVDLHGDHFPDDELFAAVDALNRLPLEKREINVEHAGEGRGHIVSAFALTEDFAKTATPPIDAQGCYGVLVTIQPDAEMLKSVEAGGAHCLSIEGSAADVITIAKSADGAIAATAHKRTMRKVTLTKIAIVAAGAHEGAAVSIVKSAPDAATLWKAAAIAKRTPALTSIVDGHQHVIDDVSDADIKQGYTSWDSAISSGYGGHSHNWIRNVGGVIAIAMAAGHTHDIATATDLEKNDMPTDLEKSQAAELLTVRADLAKSNARCSALSAALLAAASMPPEQLAFAKSLTGDALEAYVAKPSAERAAMATPIYKSVTTGESFFAGDNRIELAKALDAQGAELQKARESGESAAFAKTAGEKMKHLAGGQAPAITIVKALHGKAITVEERDAALASLAANDAAVAMVTKSIGVGGGDPLSLDASDPKVVLEKALATFAKSHPELSAIDARREFSRDEEGQRLYAAAYPTGS